MKTFILLAISFTLASCTQPPPTKGYAEWIESHKVEVFYERGYKDFFKQLPFIDDPCLHKFIKREE